MRLADTSAAAKAKARRSGRFVPTAALSVARGAPLTPALCSVPSHTHARAYILDEATPPEDLQGVYQLCDLHQREIKAVVSDPAFASSVYNVRRRGARLLTAADAPLTSRRAGFPRAAAVQPRTGWMTEAGLNRVAFLARARCLHGPNFAPEAMKALARQRSSGTSGPAGEGASARAAGAAATATDGAAAVAAPEGAPVSQTLLSQLAALERMAERGAWPRPSVGAVICAGLTRFGAGLVLRGLPAGVAQARRPSRCWTWRMRPSLSCWRTIATRRTRRTKTRPAPTLTMTTRATASRRACIITLLLYRTDV